MRVQLLTRKIVLRAIGCIFEWVVLARPEKLFVRQLKHLAEVFVNRSCFDVCPDPPVMIATVSLSELVIFFF
jgi:hypothetical protein